MNAATSHLIRNLCKLRDSRWRHSVLRQETNGTGRQTTGYDLTSASNGEGVTITYGIDGAERSYVAASSLSDSNHPGTLATVNSFYPSGQIQTMTLGNGLK